MCISVLVLLPVCVCMYADLRNCAVFFFVVDSFGPIVMTAVTACVNSDLRGNLYLMHDM